MDYVLSKLRVALPEKTIQELNEEAGRKKYMVIKRPEQVITDRDLQRSTSFVLQDTFKKGESNIGSVQANVENNLVENEKAEFQREITKIAELPGFGQWTIALKDYFIDLIYDLRYIDDRFISGADENDGRYPDKEQLVYPILNFDEFLGLEPDAGRVIKELYHSRVLTMEEFLRRCVSIIEGTVEGKEYELKGEYMAVTSEDMSEVSKLTFNSVNEDFMNLFPKDTEADRMVAKSLMRSQGFTL